MKLSLVLQKKRFDYLINKLQDTIVVNKEVKEEDGSHWVYFDMELQYSSEVLAVFHAGIDVGMDTMKNIYTAQ